MDTSLFQEFLMKYPNLEEKINEIEETLDLLFITGRLEFMFVESPYFFCGIYLYPFSIEQKEKKYWKVNITSKTGFSSNYSSTTLQQKNIKDVFYEELYEVLYRTFFLDKKNINAVKVVKRDLKPLNILYLLNEYKRVKSEILSKDTSYATLFIENDKIYFTNWITGKVKPLSLKACTKSENFFK